MIYCSIQIHNFVDAFSVCKSCWAFPVYIWFLANFQFLTWTSWFLWFLWHSSGCYHTSSNSMYTCFTVLITWPIRLRLVWSHWFTLYIFFFLKWNLWHFDHESISVDQLIRSMFTLCHVHLRTLIDSDRSITFTFQFTDSNPKYTIVLNRGYHSPIF